MRRVLRSRPIPAVAGLGALIVGLTVGCEREDLTGLTVDGEALTGAIVGVGETVDVGVSGAVSVQFLLDGTYLDTDTTAPFTWTVSGSDGEHELRAHARDASGVETLLEAAFRIDDAGSGLLPPAVPIPPVPAAPGSTVSVATPEQLRDALASAGPGSVIQLADGTYRSERRLVASANGTPTAPITLRGSRGAILTSTGPSGDYGLHITGDYWHVLGITVADASKGVVLDGSLGTVLDGIEVRGIGDEGVHFRSCSSDGVLRNSVVRDTGLRAPRFGEGVYVGSANSKWVQHGCADGRDNSENVLVEGSTFQNTTAEGADIKEGTDSGTLRGNVFDNTGWSGENSADSAVDVKGNGWLIEGNVVRNASGAFLDAFQTHSAASGYGTRNTFRGNRVEGPIPGFGFGLHQGTGNTVTCDNSAPGAERGLVGIGSKPARCG